MLPLKVKLLREGAKLPLRSSALAAAWDVFIPEDIALREGIVTKVPLGIAVEPPLNYWLMLAVRSSAGAAGIMLANGIGVIDNDYRGELIALLYNTNQTGRARFCAAGARLVQLIPVVMLAERLQICDVETLGGTLSNTTRGAGGLGHTGE